MSEQTNIQVVQTAFGYFGKGDVAGIISLLAADVSWHVAPIKNVPYTGTRNGTTGVADFFATLAESEDTLKFEPREFIAQGDKVVAIGQYGARVKSTGREYETYFAQVFTLRDGKLTSFVEYLDSATVADAFVKTQTA